MSDTIVEEPSNLVSFHWFWRFFPVCETSFSCENVLLNTDLRLIGAGTLAVCLCGLDDWDYVLEDADFV